MARPTKYSDETVALVVKAVKLGLTYELAASYAGIAYETFRTWREKKPAFSAAVAEAEASGAMTNMARIQKEAQEGEWRAAAWIMEHRYGYAGQSEINHRGEFTHTVNLHGVAPEDV